MPTFYASDFSLTSRWTVVRDPVPGMTTPTLASNTVTFDFGSIAAGTPIESAVLYADLGSPSTGAALRTVDNVSFSGSRDVSITPGGTNSFTFRFRANGTTDLPIGNRASTLTVKNVRVEVTLGQTGGGTNPDDPPPPPPPPPDPEEPWEPPPPVSQYQSPQFVWFDDTSAAAPGESRLLKWSVGSPGPGRTIRSYDVFRSTYATGGFAYHTGAGSGLLQVPVSSATTNGTTYYYKVLTIQDDGTYYAWSNATATLKTLWTNPDAPGTPTVSQNNVQPGQTVTLSWTQAGAGIHNPVTGYTVQRSVDNVNWSTLKATTSTSLAVKANTGTNSSYYYRVRTTGSLSNSAYSGSVRLITKVDPLQAPVLRIAGTTTVPSVAPGATHTLTWTAPATVTNNSVTGYRLYRKITGGSWVHITNYNTSTLSAQVKASTTTNVTHSYYIVAVGSRIDSGNSNTVSHKCVYTLPTVSSPTVSSTWVKSGHGNVTFSWNAQAGTNIPISSFTIYRNNVAWKSSIQAAARSYAVPTHTTAGSAYSYSIVAIGGVSGYNSTRSSNATVNTYGNPTAPTTVTLNNIAGTIYVGTTAYAPVIALRWSGATAGSGATITGYDIHKDGAYWKTVSTTAGSGEIAVDAANATYSVITVASSTLKSPASTARSVSVIGLPNDIVFTSQPTNRTNGTVTYTWNAVTVPNATISYGIAYRVGTGDLVWLGSTTGTSYNFNMTTNNRVPAGSDYQLAVIAQATATHGGVAQRNYVYSGNTAFRAANPAVPVITSVMDKSGNTAYTGKEVHGTFSYTVPERGSPTVKYNIYYRYGTASGFTLISEVTDKSFVHNVSSVDGGIKIYYQVQVTDEYGNSSQAITTSPIEKLHNPDIDTPVFVPSSAPHSSGTLTFTPRGGGSERPLIYRVRLSYDHQFFNYQDYTAVPNVGQLLTVQNNDLSINTLQAGGLTNLFTKVITDKVVRLRMTVEISLRDNQTPAVVDNETIYSFSYDADFSTLPVLTGTIGVINKTAADNLQNDIITNNINYLNSGDEVEWDFSDLSYEWKNAAGTEEGADLRIHITDSTGSTTMSQWPQGKKKKYTLGTITGDNIIKASVHIAQSYADYVITYSDKKEKSIEVKRFIKPAFVLTNYERTAANIFKTALQMSDAFVGGSPLTSNILSLTDIQITDGTVITQLDEKVEVVSNQLIIDGATAPRIISGLETDSALDTIISISGTLMLTSGRTYNVGSSPVLLKALGVAASFRKSRVGINVEPTTFLDGENVPALVLTEKNINISGPQMEIVSGLLNEDGVGIRLVDTMSGTTGLINYQSGVYYIGNNELEFDSVPSVILTNNNYTNYSPTLTGTGASGTWGISITGNAASATKLTTARTLTIGSTGKTFNGTGNVSWSLAEIGAVPINDTLGGVYVSRNAGGLTGSVTGSSAVGAIRLDFGTANQMLNARITIRSYTYLVTIVIGGYTYSSTTAWHMPQAYGLIDGGDLKVRFCSSDESRYITIGDTDTSWSGYPFVTIDELNSGYANTHLQNIPVSLVTAYPGTVNKTITIPGGVNITSNNYNDYAPTLTGTGASGSWGISITGNAATASTATKLTTARTLTIGNEGKTFNGSANVSWTLAEIGAAAASHNHSATNITSGTLPVARGGTGVTTAKAIALLSYPVGSIYIAYTSTSPATRFGGTWSALSTGYFLRTGTAWGSAGADSHTHTTGSLSLTVAQLPSHSHKMKFGDGTKPAGGVLGAQEVWKTAIYEGDVGYSTGSGSSHNHGATGSGNNIPKHYKVFMWRRTA